LTEAERKLWDALRDKRFEGFRFRRQFSLGPYTVDFVCLERRLIIEVDGGQHSDSSSDMRRDVWLEARGFKVLRFWNIDIFQAMDGTLLKILDALKDHPSPAARDARRPLPQGGRSKELRHGTHLSF
jgi:very-short-patch-repair endonuclease